MSTSTYAELKTDEEHSFEFVSEHVKFHVLKG